MRRRVLREIKQQFGDQDVFEVFQDSEFKKGVVVSLKMFSPGIVFSDPVKKMINKGVVDATFIAKPEDSCYPGIHQVLLSIIDSDTQIEYQSINFTVRVTDFAFDHVSRPFLSKSTSFAVGAGSLVMFILTLFGKIDAAFGLTSGTIAGILASGIYMRFLSLYQHPSETIREVY